MIQELYEPGGPRADVASSRATKSMEARRRTGSTSISWIRAHPSPNPKSI